MPEPLILPPMMERTVSGWLRTVPEVMDLVEDRVYTALPSGVTFPAVRVTQIDDTKITTQPMWVTAYFIQIEAWGGPKALAWTIASTIAAALDQRFAGEIADAVVSGVAIGGLRDLPDEEFEPARPRWMFMSTITARPTATMSAS